MNLKVGDILVYCYSYNARYPHFCRVIRTSASFVWLEEVPKKWLDHDGYGQNGRVIPNFGAPTKPMKGRYKVKYSNYTKGDYIVVNGCYASIWDGTPEDEYTD